MYIILLPDKLWYTVDTWQELKDFLKIIFASDSNTFHKTKILRRIAEYQWEDMYIGESIVK